MDKLAALEQQLQAAEGKKATLQDQVCLQLASLLSPFFMGYFTDPRFRGSDIL